jgi:hypothetical protein
MRCELACECPLFQHLRREKCHRLHASCSQISARFGEKPTPNACKGWCLYLGLARSGGPVHHGCQQVAKVQLVSSTLNSVLFVTIVHGTSKCRMFILHALNHMHIGSKLFLATSVKCTYNCIGALAWLVFLPCWEVSFSWYGARASKLCGINGRQTGLDFPARCMPNNSTSSM